MKRMVYGPGDCDETKTSAENIPFYVADILRKHGYEVNPEDIETPDGTRLSSFNLEQGIAIPGVKSKRREIRREIADEIGGIKVRFV